MSEVAVSVRRAEARDLAACAAVDRALGFVTPMPIFEGAAERAGLYVAVHGSHIVGYLRYGYLWDGYLPLIQMVRVLPEQRRQGIGTRLVKALERDLRNREIHRLLSSAEETNVGSLAFHRSLGFEASGTLTGINEDGVDEIFLLKRLG